MINRKRGPTQRNTRCVIILQKLHYFPTNILYKNRHNSTIDNTTITDRMAIKTNAIIVNGYKQNNTTNHHQDHVIMPVSLSKTNNTTNVHSTFIAVLIVLLIVDFYFKVFVVLLEGMVLVFSLLIFALIS